MTSPLFNPKVQSTLQKTKKKGLKGARNTGNTMKYSTYGDDQARTSGLRVFPDVREYRIDDDSSRQLNIFNIEAIQRHENGEMNLVTYPEYCRFKNAITKYKDTQGGRILDAFEQEHEKTPHKTVSKKKLRKLIHQQNELQQTHAEFKEIFPQDNIMYHAGTSRRDRTPLYERDNTDHSDSWYLDDERINHSKRRRRWRSTKVEDVLL